MTSVDIFNTITRTISFQQADIAYEIRGPQGAEVLLMLHPAFADRTFMELQAQYFSQEYQVILIDMPGHGDTRVDGTKVTMKDMPDIIVRLLQAHQIEACHILGISLGSLMAQAFAERYPDRVKSVTMAGGYSIHKANERILKSQAKEGLKWLWYIFTSMKGFRNYVTRVSCRSDAARIMFRQCSERFTRQSFRAMSGASSLFSKKEAPVPYPLFIIVGEHDLAIVRESSEQLHGLEPLSQWLLIPDAGHCVNADAPAAFNQALHQFLNQITIAG